MKNIQLTNYKVGLTNAQYIKQKDKFGLNTIQVKNKKNWLLAFLAEFKDLMIILLIIAAIIAIISHEIIDGIVILAIVIINAVISFVQEFRAEKALEALQKLVSPHAKVIRDGKPKIIPANDIVPGDILLIESGDRISADGIVIENNNLYTQESTLTGESVPVEKNEYKAKTELKVHHQVFMGTEVTNGFAKIQIIATGTQTKFGQIANLTQTTTKVESPLQREVKKIGIFVTKLTILIAAVLFLVGVFIQQKDLVDTLLFATSVAVAAVPEGLPATITIALALGVQRLAKKKAIVKQLASAETLGSTSCIVTDKTGTLTRNEMLACKIVTVKSEYDVSGKGYSASGDITQANNTTEANKDLDLIELTSKYCNSTLLNKKGKKYEVLGDPTEAALIVLAQKINKITKNKEKFKTLKTIPFDSERKRMSVQIGNSKQKLFLTKGAPESVLELCKLDAKTKKSVLNTNKELAGQALRVLAIAYHKRDDQEEKNLQFVGLVGIIDPPRKEVKNVIEKAKKAGIQIIVATGDNGHTAMAVATTLNIVSKNAQVFTNQDIKNKTIPQLQKLLANTPEILFARVTPEDKLKIVQAQQANNKIVAVTGDGVNDAPALKQADIGIAMGIIGTDVSKEAANMVLANDKFTTIVNAIQEGRNIYVNLKKIIFYLFSSNVGELVTIFIAIIIGLPAPLTAILILLINVGTDSLPAIALSTDTSPTDLLQEPPRPKSTHILEKKFLLHVFSIGIFIGLITLGVFLSVLYSNGWTWGAEINAELHTKAVTSAFVALIAVQFFNAFNASNLNFSIFKTKFWKKKFLLVSTFSTLPIVWAVTEVAFLQNIFKTTSLSLGLWCAIIAISSSIIIIDELYKFIIQPHKNQTY